MIDCRYTVNESVLHLFIKYKVIVDSPALVQDQFINRQSHFIVRGKSNDFQVHFL